MLVAEASGTVASVAAMINAKIESLFTAVFSSLVEQNEQHG
jgi:hypothetical protein